ncbi:hypothetical protein M758_7G087100 [Ceratodon purpureus]|nr:hypothetical protein M758_7G087100 [Ceratodon purpureus]KAG0610730.1 hypothetical protein M758_7G087100 [Ceratodon purpureus]
MADQHQNSSVDYSGSSADERNSCVVENSMWDEWTHPSNVGDEVSTSNFLPDLTTSSSSSRLSFHGQADMLSSWMSNFQHLGFAHSSLAHSSLAAPEPCVDIDPHPALFMHEANLGAPLDQPQCSCTQKYNLSGTSHSRIYIPDHVGSTIDHLEENGGSTRVVSRPRHTDIFIGPNGTFESTPGGWTPQFYDGTAETTASAMKPMKMMACLREAGESSSNLHNHHAVQSENRTMSSFLADCRPGGQNVWFGKHRLELSVDGDDQHSALQLKRSKFSVGHGSSSALKWGDQEMREGEILRTYNCPSGSLASQAMDIIAIGPALNTNGKPRARRGSATDPQSVYARQRRERINDRLKTLQRLVPNGAKVDIVTMLEEAYDYVKFLQYQLTLLKSDEFWVLANPYNYNGMDISNLPSTQTQELESDA